MSSTLRVGVIGVAMLIALFGGLALWNASVLQADAQSVSEIDQEIDAKQDEIEKLEQETEELKQKIRERQAEAGTLQTAIGDLDVSIEAKTVEIEKKQSELELVELEIEELERQIEEKKVEIDTSMKHLSDTLAQVYMLEQTTQLEIVMASSSFSDFYSNIEYSTNLQEGTQGALDTLQSLKKALDEQHTNLEDKEKELNTKKTELVNARAGLDHEQSEKENLLSETRDDEAKFQQLVEERQSTQSAINSEISRLEQRRRAAADGDGSDVLAGDVGAWVWPVSGRTITTYFDDAGYVFRRYFRHLAIDIDGTQGDPVYAANDGVVASTHFSGLSFAFIILQHADGFSTLYGHTSAIYVSVGDEVKKGDVIGAVGGLPGTPGAGGLTTGDHMHFTLYLNGTPVDPLNYLP